MKDVNLLSFVLRHYKDEAEKIHKNCGMLCTMTLDIEMLKSEVKDHKPYEQILLRHETQLERCPKICRMYKKFLEVNK